MPEIAPDIAALEQIPFFGHLGEGEPAALARTGQWLSLGAGRTIFRQGDEDQVQVAVFERAVRPRAG